MNNVTAGIVGGVAAAVVGMSALVFANKSGDEPGSDADKDRKEVAATRTECKTERIVTRKEWGAKTIGGTVLGAAAGGAVGHQFGGGSGKDAATVAGALGGAYVGNKVAKENFPDEQVSYRERCREVPAG